MASSLGIIVFTAFRHRGKKGYVEYGSFFSLSANGEDLKFVKKDLQIALTLTCFGYFDAQL